MENQEIEKKMMSIVAEDGSIEEVEVILAFEKSMLFIQKMKKMKMIILRFMYHMLIVQQENLSY